MPSCQAVLGDALLGRRSMPLRASGTTGTCDGMTYRTLGNAPSTYHGGKKGGGP